MKCKQSRPGFELGSRCSFPKTITITPRMHSLGKCLWYINYRRLFRGKKRNKGEPPPWKYMHIHGHEHPRRFTNTQNTVTANSLKFLYFCTCEDGAGWHLIPCRISPRSEFFSQAYKNWHIMWGINLGLDWPPLQGVPNFTLYTHPPRPLNFLP